MSILLESITTREAKRVAVSAPKPL